MTRQKRTRMPKISPKRAKSGNISIRFRLTQDEKQINYEITLPLKWDDRSDRRRAEDIAELIKQDIKHDFLGLQPPAFDRTLDKYRPGLSSPPTEQRPKNLIQVWHQFVEFKDKEGKVQETTLDRIYPEAEKVLEKVQRYNPGLLSPNKATQFLDYLSEHYKASTLVLYYKSWSACANWAVKREIWDNNPYSRGLSELKSQCKPAKSGKAYSDKETEIILKALATDRFTSPHACIRHSYYYQFVFFLFLTGVRPQLAIALDWEQICWESGQPAKIYFDRAHTKGILKPSKGDRNGKNTPRVFPVNNELAEIIKSIPKRQTIQREPNISKHLTNIPRPYYPNLVFPSPRGWYIDIGNFTNRTFKAVAEALVDLGEVKEYLSTFHTRHTVQNRWLESGMSEEEIAALLDTSPGMVRKHYRDARRYHEALAQRITLPTLNNKEAR